jgi:hypothetical protein
MNITRKEMFMYDYRVTEIELIISGSPTSNALDSSIKRVDYSTLPIAKLLENVENSYFIDSFIDYLVFS